MRSVASYHFLPPALIEEANRLKRQRDNLAHHFFRKHNIDFMSVGGAHAMIEELDALTEEFSALDKRVDDLVFAAFGRLGFDPDFIARHQDQEMARMKEEARLRYASPVRQSSGT